MDNENELKEIDNNIEFKNDSINELDKDIFNKKKEIELIDNEIYYAHDKLKNYDNLAKINRSLYEKNEKCLYYIKESISGGNINTFIQENEAENYISYKKSLNELDDGIDEIQKELHTLYGKKDVLECDLKEMYDEFDNHDNN